MHDGKNSAMIVLEEVDKDDFEDYWEEINGEFSENVYEINTGDIVSFTGENSEKFIVQLTYEIANKTLTIVTSANE